jgi:hypothetical protein
VFTDTYHKDIFQIWCLSIGMHFTLTHVELEDGLSILVLKTRPICHKNLQLEIVKFLKKSQLCSPAHYISHPAFFKLSCIRSRIAALVCQIFQADWNMQKSKVIVMCSRRFYLQNETIVELNVGLAMEKLI